MKKLLTLAALAGLLGVQQCLAFSVNVVRIPGYAMVPGGEFNISSAGGANPQFDAIYSRYAAVAQVNGGFETFCANPTVEIGPNPQDGTLTPTGVMKGTAYLYWRFATGTLDTSGYVYAPLGIGGRVDQAWLLQNAIWQLQGFTPYVLNDSYYTLAVTTLGLAGATGPNAGAYPVDMLTLSFTSPNGGIQTQPMLALVPDGGATLMLLGLGLSSLGAFSRRFRA